MPRRQGVVPPAQRQGDKPVAPADLWERIEAARTALEPPKPPGAFTAREYAEHTGISGELGRHRLNGMVRAGVLERGGNHFKWYRLKEGK